MLTDEALRPDELYRSEWAAGIAVLRPLASIHDAQTYVNHVLKQVYWRKRISSVRTLTVAYIPSWTAESGCFAKHLDAEMVLTVGNLCEGTLLHELAHCARGDTDNGHRAAFLKAQFLLIEREAGTASVLLPRYAKELLSRELVSGRETWLKPWLG